MTRSRNRINDWLSSKPLPTSLSGLQASNPQLLTAHYQLVLFSLIILALVSCKHKNDARDNPNYGHNSSAGRYYNIRGFKMYVETYGEGPPLLLIHGNGGSMRHFVNQVPYFSAKYRVILADSRSQGKSVDNSDSLTYEMMADDFKALLDSMKVDSAYVIGWSDGGVNGLLLASRYPKKVKKLATTGANLWPDTSALETDFVEILDAEYSSLNKIQPKTDSAKLMSKLLRLMKEEPHIPLATLNAISCPTLVIAGDHDVIKPKHTMLIYENIPKAYLWILPNAGHATLFSYKDEFNKTVDRFFSQPYRTITGSERFR